MVSSVPSAGSLVSMSARPQYLAPVHATVWPTMWPGSTEKRPWEVRGRGAAEVEDGAPLVEGVREEQTGRGPREVGDGGWGGLGGAGPPW